MLKQIYISSDCVHYDLYDVLQCMSDGTILVQLVGFQQKYWLYLNTNPNEYRPYVQEHMDTHEIKYVYIK